MTEKEMKTELSKLSKEELINQMLIRNRTIEKLSKEIDKSESKKIRRRNNEK